MAQNAQQLLDANCKPQVSREPDAFSDSGAALSRPSDGLEACVPKELADHVI